MPKGYDAHDGKKGGRAVMGGGGSHVAVGERFDFIMSPT
jgi:hypothetical protein